MKAATLKYYTTFLQFFVDWSRGQGRVIGDDVSADAALCKYFDVMILDHTRPFEGRNLLFCLPVVLSKFRQY